MQECTIKDVKLLFIFIILLFCLKIGAAYSDRNITINVTDLSGDPIENARVFVNESYAGITDENGFFILSVPSNDDDWLFQVDAENFLPQTKIEDMSLLYWGKSHLLDFILSPNIDSSHDALFVPSHGALEDRRYFELPPSQRLLVDAQLPRETAVVGIGAWVEYYACFDGNGWITEYDHYPSSWRQDCRGSGGLYWYRNCFNSTSPLPAFSMGVYSNSSYESILNNKRNTSHNYTIDYLDYDKMEGLLPPNNRQNVLIYLRNLDKNCEIIVGLSVSSEMPVVRDSLGEISGMSTGDVPANLEALYQLGFRLKEKGNLEIRVENCEECALCDCRASLYGEGTFEKINFTHEEISWAPYTASTGEIDAGDYVLEFLSSNPIKGRNITYSISFTPSSEESLGKSQGNENLLNKTLFVFVPINWAIDDIADFEEYADVHYDFWADNLPLAACKDAAPPIKVTTPLSVEVPDSVKCVDFDEMYSAIRSHVSSYLGEGSPGNSTYIVAIDGERFGQKDVMGFSCHNDIVVVQKEDEAVTSHELGHEFGLTEEYNNIANGPPNPLAEEYGCDAETPECCFRKCANSREVCCYGNKNSAGGRSIMSYSEKENDLNLMFGWIGYYGTSFFNFFTKPLGLDLNPIHPLEKPRRFDPPALEHLGQYTELRCN